jgi:hypothetical protein
VANQEGSLRFLCSLFPFNICLALWSFWHHIHIPLLLLSYCSPGWCWAFPIILLNPHVFSTSTGPYGDLASLCLHINALFTSTFTCLCIMHEWKLSPLCVSVDMECSNSIQRIGIVIIDCKCYTYDLLFILFHDHFQWSNSGLCKLLFCTSLNIACFPMIYLTLKILKTVLCTVLKFSLTKWLLSSGSLLINFRLFNLSSANTIVYFYQKLNLWFLFL